MHMHVARMVICWISLTALTILPPVLVNPCTYLPSLIKVEQQRECIVALQEHLIEVFAYDDHHVHATLTRTVPHYNV